MRLEGFECRVIPLDRPAATFPRESTEKIPVRAYIDGCFDVMHSGHYNAIRQAKTLCDVLVVGVHSDKEIKKHKGAHTSSVVIAVMLF